MAQPARLHDIPMDPTLPELLASSIPPSGMPQTVVEMIVRLSERGDRGPVFLDGALTPRRWSFRRLVEQARRTASFLRTQGVEPGATVALILPDPEEFVTVFLGAILAGAIPVPLANPLSARAMPAYAAHCRSILDRARCTAVVSSERVAKLASGAWPELSLQRRLLLSRDIPRHGPCALEPCGVRPQDPCFLQFTSGSTSAPKGVVVTHANVLANARAIVVDWLGIGPEDVGASWLPLFHDMGLIGFVLAPLLSATPVVFIPTMAFIQRPSVWMRVVSDYGATVTVAPNFALALAARRAPEVERLDLRHLRVLGCGAEPINAHTLANFQQRFARAGLRDDVFSPVYGLAEHTLLATCRPAGEPYRTLDVDTLLYEREGRALVRDGSALGRTTRLVACGSSLPHHTLQIWSEDGVPLPPGRVGEVVLRGPSRTYGYFGDPEPVSPLLRTGDLGFLHDDQLYICGRKKDVIILHGRNFYPQDIERAVEQVPDVRVGSVVAFSSTGADGDEELVVLAEAMTSQVHDLEKEIRRHLSELLGVPCQAVYIVRRGSIPKTSSGKLQRAKARARWLRCACDPARFRSEEGEVPA